MLLCVELGRAGTGDGDGGRKVALWGRVGGGGRGPGGTAMTAVGFAPRIPGENKTHNNNNNNKNAHVDVKQEEGGCGHAAPRAPQLRSAPLAEEIRETKLPSSC